MMFSTLSDFGNSLVLCITLCVLRLPFSEGQQNGCVFETRRNIYDFNGLSFQSWQVLGIRKSPLRYASVSLCNKTHISPCGDVSVCVIDEKNGTWSSLGGNFHVEEESNNEIIKFTSLLHHEGVDPVTAEISFSCDDEVGGPLFVNFEKKHMSLIWGSIASCPLKNPEAFKRCIFIDKNLPKIINLQSLHHLLHYTTTDGKGNTYYVNICGGTVPGSVCGMVEGAAVCEIDSANRTNVLALPSKQLITMRDGLVLEFKNTGKHRSGKKTVVTIEIICNTSVSQGELKFKSDTNTTHTFELETSLACVMGPVDCTAQDDDRFRYDLSPLMNRDQIVHGHKKDIRYVLSICRPLESDICSGGASVCIEDGNSSFSLGNLHGGPQIIDHDLIISYSGGARCNNSNVRYRSVIKFECAMNDSSPILVGTSECVNTFSWSTKAACPSVSSVGRNCKVFDEVHGYEFDLNPLHKHGDYVIVSENGVGKIDLNVCGTLSKACNGKKNVSVCITDSQRREYAIGEEAVSPHYDDGRLSFVLKGDSCEENKLLQSTVHIIFMCSHLASPDRSLPEFFTKGPNCTYFFMWHTDIACATFSIHNCYVTDDEGYTYDLSPLSSPEFDHIYMQKLNNGWRKFFINVCRPVLFGHESRCSSETGICMVDLREPNNQKRFIGLGEASALKFDREKKILKLEYNNGGICFHGSETEMHSVITFICDPEGNEASEPVLLRENGCSFEFEWRTVLACSEKVSSNLQKYDCEIHNLETGIELDFHSLAYKEHVINNSAGDTFRIAVCGSMNSMEGIGICKEEGKSCVNTGIGNSDLLYDGRSIYLNYTDGVGCTETAKKYTVINFTCDTTNSGLPQVTSQSLCTYTVTWPTSLACVVPCLAEDPSKKINLSLLRNSEHNYKTNANGTDYFLNVCQPLVPVQGLSCYSASASCKAVSQMNSNWMNEVNLGFPHLKPQLKNGSAVLEYTSATHCPNSISQNLSTSIIFSCDPLTRIGSPVLQRVVSDCHYEFLWRTSVVCDDYEMDIIDRNLYNKQNNMLIDMQPLCKNEIYPVRNYIIKMCGPSLCEVQKIENHKALLYGKVELALFSYSENVTKLHVSGGDQCKNRSSEKYSAVITLHCHLTVMSRLYIVKELECSVEILWITKAACSHPPNSTDEVDTSVTDVTPAASSSRRVSIAAVVLGIVLTVIASLLVIYFRKPTCKHWCRIKMRRLFSRHQNHDYHYNLDDAECIEFDASSAESL